MKQRLTQYIGIDKIVHFLGSYFIAASIFILFGNVFFAICVALIIGLIKEYKFDAVADWKDIAANIAGVSALLIQYLIA